MGLIDLVVQPVATRWGNHRLVRSLSYRVGEVIGRRPRVLRGAVPTGSHIYLLSRDHQHRAIYFLRDYEPELVALLQRRLRPGDIFFDVGANVGYFTVIAADLGADVHAFEPNPRIRALLDRTAASLPGVSVSHAAASDRIGTARLSLAEDTNTGQASLSIKRQVGVDVPTLTLDDYCVRVGRWPSVLKIDVERHEEAVLRGAAAVLASAKPLVILEAVDDAAVDLLTSTGYSAHHVEPDGRLTRVDGAVEYAGQYVNLAFVWT